MQALMLMGSSKRLKGKPFIKIKGKELFLYGYDILNDVFSRVLVVCEESMVSRIGEFGVNYVSESYGIGPLGGMLAGAASLSDEQIFIAGCDMPLLSPEVIDYLSKRISADGIVPKHEKGQIEPLHSFLRREILLDIDIQRERRISGLLKRIKVKYEAVGNIRRYDKDLLTFRNINTQSDLEWFKNYI